MQTREILSIVALAALGLCLLCGLAKMAIKNPKAKQSCDHACSLSLFVAVVLVGVSQLLEEEGYRSPSPVKSVPAPISLGALPGIIANCECGSSSKKCKPACPGSGKYCAGKNAYTPPFISDWKPCTKNSDCGWGDIQDNKVCKPVEQIAVSTMAKPPHKRLVSIA